jgi:hypothetical protein
MELLFKGGSLTTKRFRGPKEGNLSVLMKMCSVYLRKIKCDFPTTTEPVLMKALEVFTLHSC